MGTCEHCFVFNFPSNCWFFNKIVAYEGCFCCLQLLVSPSNLSGKEWKGKTKKQRVKCAPWKLWTWSTLFGIFHCHYCMTKIVKIDWNGNAIVALVPEIIVVSWITIVASLISFEIPVERFFNHIRGHFFFYAMHIWGAVGQQRHVAYLMPSPTVLTKGFRATVIFQMFCNSDISSATLSLGKQLIWV